MASVKAISPKYLSGFGCDWHESVNRCNDLRVAVSPPAAMFGLALVCSVIQHLECTHGLTHMGISRLKHLSEENDCYSLYCLIQY